MIGVFLTRLRFEDDGGFPFRLINPLVYSSTRYGTISVPFGFRTDLASIPRLLWGVLPPIGRYDAAAVVHDYLYLTMRGSRKEADDILFEAMRVSNSHWLTCWAVYIGVRLGGWMPWNHYREKFL